MGDRIAIMKQGGVLAQYATPQELLESPADEFVADFVGVGRGVNGLALRHTSVDELLHEIREGGE
jgi:osmoprotectant transport system ATP-binding protein